MHPHALRLLTAQQKQGQEQQRRQEQKQPQEDRVTSAPARSGEIVAS